MSLEYLVKAPKEVKEKNGALLLIHGYGSNEEDLFSFAPQLPEDVYVISIRAPFNLQPYGYAWYEITFDADENKFSDTVQAQQSRDLIAVFIDELLEKYPIDAKSVTLVGFSQGAILSYAIGLSYPQKIARIAAFSGYFNAEIAVPNFEQKEVSKLAIFASHGTVDQVVPFEWGQKAKQLLSGYGVLVDFHSYPIGHGISPQNFFDFKNWLISTK